MRKNLRKPVPPPLRHCREGQREALLMQQVKDMAARFSMPIDAAPSLRLLPPGLHAGGGACHPYRIWFSCAHHRTLRVGEDTRGRLYPCGPEKRVWLQFQHCGTDKQVARLVTSTKVGRGLLPPPSQPCRACAHQHLCSSGHL